MDQKHDADLENAIAQWENDGGACCRDASYLEEEAPPSAEDEYSAKDPQIGV